MTKNRLTVVETGEYYRSSLKHRHSHKYPLKQWSTLFIALSVALITASLIITINRRAERSSQAHILLVYIREQLIQISALKWQAIAEKKLNSELFAEVQNTHLQIHYISHKLEVIEPDKSRL